MSKSRHSEAQIIAALKQVEAGRTVDDVARECGVSKHTIYAWKAKFGGMDASEAQKLRQLSNVSVVEAAVGEAAATMQLYVPNRPSGWMSLHPRGDSFARNDHFTTRDVRVLKLDDLLRDKEVDHVDFLKMDLEGHEFFAMRGARSYLEQGRISALSFEFGSANVNSRTFFRDLWGMLDPLGYQVHRIVPGGRTIRILRYDETLEFFRGATNYVASLGG